MCTVVILASAYGGYRMVMNRDEQHSRASALPVRLLVAGSTRLLAPIDAQAGGTWLAVNEYGMGLALLNAYELLGPPPPWQTRGAVILAVAAARELEEAEARLKALELSHTRPFELAFVQPGAAGESARAVQALWNGSTLCLGSLPLPALLTSSSVDLAGARRQRRQDFSALIGDLDRDGPDSDGPDILASWAAGHAPAAGPVSTCMHRADASTVSSTQIEVTSGTVFLRHHAGSPCLPAPASVHELPRVVPSGAATGLPS